MKTITSKDNELIKYFYKLKDISFSKKEGKFLVENLHLIKEGVQYLEYILTLKKVDFIEEDRQILVNENILKKLSNSKSTPKIIGVCKTKEENELSENIVIYLNKVQDPGNVGTIFRTALAFNFLDVMCDEGTASKFNQKVIQASQGAIFKENIVLSDASKLMEMKKRGYKIVVTALSEDSITPNMLKKDEKMVIVFGNEGQGVDQEIIKIADYIVKIPISNIDSLNVSISAGILLYNLCSK